MKTSWGHFFKTNYLFGLCENLFYCFFTLMWILFDTFENFIFVRTHWNGNLYDKMRKATTFEEWKNIALYFDLLLENDRWRKSIIGNYDYELILSRLNHLRVARANEDIAAMIYSIRAGLLRNLGGLSDASLYSKSLVGTKHLIEDYINEIVLQLNYICEKDYEKVSLSLPKKLEFISETKQSFGNTALQLHGGATFGLYHLGVVKCLYQNNLLPRIVCGSSVGALIAALVCTTDDNK